MKIRILSIIISLFITSIIFINTSYAKDFDEPEIYNTFKITNIVDGDTVDADIYLGFNTWVHNVRLRITGLDTPESRTSDKTEKVYGLLSKKYITNLLSSPDDLKLYIYGVGKFGRPLADFQFLDGTFLVDKMIQECYAVAYHGQNKADVEMAHLDNRECLSENGVVK